MTAHEVLHRRVSAPHDACRTGFGWLVVVLATAIVPDAAAFKIAADQVRAIGVYTAIEVPPAVPVLDVQDPAAIATFIAGIEFDQQRDCSEYGAAPQAIAYVKFADGEVERYELLAGYEYVAKPGLPGACYALSDAASDQFRAITHVTSCADTVPVCNGFCGGSSACAASGICTGGPLAGYPCSQGDPAFCLGYPCVTVACVCAGD